MMNVEGFSECIIAVNYDQNRKKTFIHSARENELQEYGKNQQPKKLYKNKIIWLLEYLIFFFLLHSNATIHNAQIIRN